jgi:anti-sigma-K factor RskA
VSERIHNSERLEELWADGAVFGLNPEERREREALEAEGGGLALADEYELAAAAVALVQAGRRAEPLPAALKAKLEGGGRAWLATRAPQAPQAPEARLRALPPAATERPSPFPWLVAAAAAVLAIAGWWPRTQPNEPSKVVVAPQPAELRANLLAAGALRVDAQGTELAKGAGGDVVWDNKAQSGWMRLTNLPVNDPNVQQYQLWIFDESQEHPVDGGVFNVSAAGELLVPIDAKLKVGKPTLFAITVEKPGGVVVSDRQRIAWVAKPG